MSAMPARAGEQGPKPAVTEEQALKAARESGAPVEVLAGRGESRTVRALPNGRMEVEQHIRPIRARQGGGWADIDTGLRRSGADVVPAATTVGLRFSGGGDGPMVQMTRAGRKLALTWPTPLPEPVLDGDTATYKGVLGADVDLQLRAEADGFAHTLVVKTAEAAKDPRLARLVLPLSSPGLSVTQEPASGVLTAKTSAGTAVFDAPSPMMWDSTKAPAGAQRAATSTTPQGAALDAEQGPAEGAKTAPIKVTASGGKLTLTPDKGLLTAADTTFPVYIDPVWGAHKASAWGMVSSGYPDQSYYTFNGKSTEGLGRCEVAKDGNCVKNQTKRLFYRVTLPSLKGRYVQAVEFTAYETGAYDCNNATSVQLWRTAKLQSYATWNNTNNSSVWGERLTSRDVTHCSRAPVEFGGSLLRSHVQSALDKGYGTITFGLKAYSESTMDWWKRFADDAYLSIQYNNPPYAPNYKSMTTKPGGVCAPKSDPVVINRVPTLSGYFWDPDDEDENKVQPEFASNWDAGDGKGFVQRWSSGLIAPAAKSGTQRSTTMPDTIPQRTLIGWHARAYDGEQYSPWSSAGAPPACYFIYDPAKPAPTITSTDYPDDDQWHGGVGQEGLFTITDPEGVADRYDVRLNQVPIMSVATTGGAARTIRLAPNQYGPNSVTVVAFGPSGQNSAAASINFLANEGAPAKARFTLDEAAGSTTAAAQTRDGEPAVTATLQGGANLGQQGQIETALTLDGTGYASTGTPLVDTGKSFSVSAWVRLGDPGGRTRTVLSQDGTSKSGFYLKYEPATQKWVLSKVESDSTEEGAYQAYSPHQAELDTWTHLVGVYDDTTKKLQIYVNGDAGTPSPQVPVAWNATGGFQIGRSLWWGEPADHWPGQVDDVRVYDRILSNSEISGLYQQAPVLKARWKLNAATDGVSPGEARNDGVASPLRLRNGAAISAGAGFKGPFVSPAGLQLGATGAYAEADPAVTAGGDALLSTDESFTLTGWMQNLQRPQSAATVFSLPGSQTNAFALRYLPDAAEPADLGAWQLEMNNADLPAGDASKPQRLTSNSAYTEDDWDHLAIVYDATNRTMSLYINGSTVNGPDGDSAAGDVRPFKAAGGLQVGRNSFGGNGAGTDFWPAAMDDVWLYQGVLSPTQIAQLGQAIELGTDDGP
ncbi:LamG-like jellyroll fold domain-containing protein [Actinomadura bangladeshensis]|uniref:LamG domain-containing protein n=1 Tax=Actinomadura bangladeshensis TaxID=453573 RepID=A0A6L9Q6M7_9ACTN|nr:LamG-like jellyroll fold domain-containing protein [Actinomadura bangladeshensis]NEA21109.1 LamG domain-containing protein [Actinomadura bangladeshensis]